LPKRLSFILRFFIPSNLLWRLSFLLHFYSPHSVMVATLLSSNLYNNAPNCARYSTRTALSLKMGPIGCPETSVTKYQPTEPNISEEWRRDVSVSLQ
jgi:hypothetical protein